MVQDRTILKSITVPGYSFTRSFFHAIFLIFSLILGLFSIRCQSSLLIPIKKSQDEHLIQASNWSGNSAWRVGSPHRGQESFSWRIEVVTVLSLVWGTTFVPPEPWCAFTPGSLLISCAVTCASVYLVVPALGFPFSLIFFNSFPC